MFSGHSFFLCWSVVVIRKSASQRANNLVWRVVGSTLDSSFHITCLESLLNCQIMLFQVLGSWLHLKELFLCLGLTVTEIMIKKGQKQENKNVKRCSQKVCKQGRDDA